MNPRPHRSDRGRTLNLDVLIPLLLLDRTAVDFKADVVVFDDDVADAGPVAGFRGGSPKRDQMLQFRAAGADGSILEFQSSLPHGKIRADVDQLLIENVDNLFAGLLGDPRRRSIPGERQPAEQREAQKDR